MRPKSSFSKLLLLGTVLIGSIAAFPAVSQAKTHHLVPKAASLSVHNMHKSLVVFRYSGHVGHRNAKYVFTKGWKRRYAHATYGGLQCVPFARAASGIELKGNAANWWDAAAGVYERGSEPEPGSVLNFRATGRMHLGHVAVVTAVLGPREIQIEHANWSKGSVARNVSVVDMSPGNDWTEVRVELGRSGDYGSLYPTYGFIYDRPDTGTMVASQPQTMQISAVSNRYDEVAEAPVNRRKRAIPAVQMIDAPARSIQ
jgi:surface antigen